MAETVGQVLQRPVKGYFTAIHVEGEVEGEVEPQFCDDFKNELGRFWHLYDSNGLQLRVEFEHNGVYPTITDGWIQLREHYGFEGHHEIFFKYPGTNQFQIIPNMAKIYPSSFPTCHSSSRCLRKAVSFKLTMTEDPKVNPHLILQENMGDYLCNTSLDKIFIIGENLKKQLCQLDYQLDLFEVRISRGWSECVGIHGFEVGDHLEFNIRNIYDGHLIW